MTKLNYKFNVSTSSCLYIDALFTKLNNCALLIARQMAEHHRSGSEDPAPGRDVNSGVPRGSDHHEEVQARPNRSAIRCLFEAGARLHCPRVHAQRFTFRVPQDRDWADSPLV